MLLNSGLVSRVCDITVKAQRSRGYCRHAENAI